MRGYAEAGGLRGAIAASAERAYTALPPDEQAIARRIFIELTALNIDAPDTRRRVKLEGLLSNSERAKQAEAVLNGFIQARLVTGGEGQTYEVAHEAVIRNWPQLAGWLQANRTDLLLARQIQESADRWRDNGQDASDLYRGLRLKEAVAWLKSHPDDATMPQREYVEASLAEEARQLAELQALERRAKSARRLTLVLALVAVAITLAGLIIGTRLQQSATSAVSQAQTATAQVGVALSTLEPIPATLTAVSKDIQSVQAEGTTVALKVMNTDALFRADQARRELRDDRPRNAFVLALESLKNYPVVYNPESSQALDEAVNSPWRETAFQHDASVYGAAWNKDETKILTWSDDKTARVWDAASGKPVFSLTHDASVRGAAWNKDETKILTWSEDKTARVSNVTLEYNLRYARDWLARASTMPASERARLLLPEETPTSAQSTP